jgi:hypothetical protein
MVKKDFEGNFIKKKKEETASDFLYGICLRRKNLVC